MLVRREASSDFAAIDAIHRSAFAAQANGDEPAEVGLVHRLREDSGFLPALSLVAENAAGAVIGHVIATEGTLQGFRALGLGPIGVIERHQSHGVGTALMHSVIGAADALAYDVVVLLGHRDYYSRFGFVEASTVGIAAPDPEWGAHFQARRLSCWTPDVGGTFQYAAPFQGL